MLAQLKKLAGRAIGRARYKAPANIELVHRMIDAPEAILRAFVTIETLSYCNSACTFCPANSIVDTRGKNHMPDAIFDKILADLAAWKFNGVVCMHGNSEPLLNPNIADMVRRVRAALPEAMIALWTNGTKLDWKKHEALFANGLNHMHINNYTTRDEFHKPVKAFLKAFHESRFSNSPDVLVQSFVRKIDEVLYNKAGMAPNKTAGDDFVPMVASCGSPVRSMQINYKGDLYSCCFDDYYAETFGNVMDASLDDLWGSAAYRQFRRKIIDGDRRDYKSCAKCDTPHEGARDWKVKDTSSGRTVHVSPGVFFDSPLTPRYIEGSRSFE